MGKASKWVRKFLLGKKEKGTEKLAEKSSFYDQPSVIEIDHFTTTPITIPPTTPKEKRRWSFRRSSATAPGQRDFISVDAMSTTPTLQHASMDFENDPKKHALAVAVATAAAADAAAAAAKAAAAVFQLTAAAASGRASGAIEEAAAVKIQSAYRGYLARTALNALRGLVKLQAMVRGHLVRKQATATLRCMQALVTAQERARLQRIQMVEDAKINNQKQFSRKSSPDHRFRQSNQDFDRSMEEHIKIVEMDMGDYRASTKSRYSYSSYGQTELMEPRISTRRAISKQENQHISPAPSDMNDLSPKARSGHFEEYSIGTAQSSPQYYYSDVSKPDDTSRVAPFTYARSELGDSYYNEYQFHPNYMSNTQSSRAKVRSHSAPKQRPEAFERQPSRRSKPSIEGRNVPRAVKMQRSSSNLGSVARSYNYPWSVKLDKSSISLKDSDCGSNYTVQSVIPTSYCRSVVGF